MREKEHRGRLPITAGRFSQQLHQAPASTATRHDDNKPAQVPEALTGILVPEQAHYLVEAGFLAAEKEAFAVHLSSPLEDAPEGG